MIFRFVGCSVSFQIIYKKLDHKFALYRIDFCKNMPGYTRTTFEFLVSYKNI